MLGSVPGLDIPDIVLGLDIVLWWDMVPGLDMLDTL